ncbi:ATP-binding protein [Helcococcus kunzii]|uniref:ATP-binding protein n=1 Tax=Helcococcus kunzii TaxID=40091 RepID=UPI0024AE5BE9|nr:ATP-binding protein [Helcococcus kunzii]
MKTIEREIYLDRIKKFIDIPVIKILVGMRRVGKSTLMEQIKDNLLSKVKEKNKIYMNFESFKFSDIKNEKNLYEYIYEKIGNSKDRFYLFFDEIQLVENWQRAINSFRVDFNCDIYITGSNSSLLSGDLSTLLAGRFVEFQIKPFTFIEFKELYSHSGLNNTDLFRKYIELGGMPLLKYFNFEKEPSFKYLRDVYNTVIVKDVLTYNNIRDVDLFNRILNYTIENIAKTFSATSIRNYLKNEGLRVSIDTVLNYLEMCRDAFIIDKVSRYDYIGKKVLKIEEKYFINDHGFREAIGFSNTKNIERTLENIIYNELISRNYKIKVGRIGECEIDFIAEKDKEVKYFQIAYLLETEKTRDREFGVYKNITDNYPKYVLSMDENDFSQNGIIHKNIIDFLLQR